MAAKKSEKQPLEIWSFKDLNVEKDIDAAVKIKIKDCLDRNFLVQAVPGSGKTYNLVQRIISLILNGRPAAGIAAITFTRKAAEELRGRLVEMIEARSVAAPAYEKALLQKGLLDIEDGYVGTIHGFCAGILREYPVEACLDPAFIEIEEGDEEAFFCQTWNEILTEFPELLKPFADHDVDPEESSIIKSLRRFCQFPDIDFSCPATSAPDVVPLVDAVVNGWQKVRSCDPRLMMTDAELLEKAEVAKHWLNLEKLAGRLEKFSGRTSFTPEDLQEIRRAIRFLAKLSLQTGKEDDDKELVNGCSKMINEECAAFREKYSSFLFPQILPLLQKIREKEQQWRNQRGYVSYLDLLSRTVQLLKDAPHIRKSVQQKFPVLMIDEFQDTDPLQAEMAFLLTSENLEEKNWLNTVPKPGSLFLVGDPKQSVYRFRRADINIYLQAARHLEKTGGEILTLQQNRRSVKGVCGWVNRAFKPAFEQQQSLGQAPFDEMLPLREIDEDQAVKGFELPGTIRGGATRQMAAYDAEKFADIIGGMLGMSVPGIKDGAVLQPDDFMILCRKNDELVNYAMCLEKKGIGVNLTGGGKTLAATLQDDFRPLYWLLRALSDCDEPSVVWAVLVGPIFGLNDEEIYGFKMNGGRISCSFMPEGDSEVSRVLRKMCLYRKWMQELVPGAAFRRIVASLKYDAYLLGREYGLLKTTFLAHVARLFDSSLFSQAVNILGNWVLHWPVEKSIDEPGRVRLMTMHKAKGLEAPVVFLGMTSRPRFYDPEVMIVKKEDSTHGLLNLSYSFGDNYSHPFAISPGWAEARPLEETANKCEKLRLDYVACSRARDLLIISRHHNKSGKLTTTLAAEVEPAVDNCPEFIVQENAAPPAQSGQTGATACIEELTEWRLKRREWRQKSCNRRLSEANVTGLTEKAEKTFSKSSDGGRALGVLVHALLCNLLRWRVEAGSEKIALLLDRELENDEAMRPRRSAILKLLANVLHSDLWKEALKTSEVHTEVPFVSFDKASDRLPFNEAEKETDFFLNGIIDLVYRFPGGWKIVDYKTNKIDSEEHRAQLNAFYQSQLDIYADRWQKLTGEKVVEKSLFYVRDAVEVRLV